MGGVGWLIRSRLRSRWAALLVIALVATLGATGTFIAVGAADRTASAYSRYLDRADVGDVVINPSLLGRDIDRVVRTLPGVESVSSSALFLAGVWDGPPPTKAQLDEDPTAGLVLGSADGRYERMDRPVLAEGRLPTGRREMVVNVEQARDQHLHVGDVLPLSFWSRLGDLIDPPTAIEKPIAVEHVRVVGIVTLSDEVLPDGVYPRQRIIVSADVAKRHDCLPDAPAPDATIQEAATRLAPVGCATSYHYYSLKIRGGDRGVTTALAAFAKRSDELTAKLPKAVRAIGAAYTLVAKTATRDEQDRIDRSIAPVVTALIVLAAAAAAITMAILGLVIARELGRARNEQSAWWRLGLTTYQRARIVIVPLLAAVGGGLVVAVLLAWLLSPVAPLGTVRVVDPSPGHEISSWVWLTTLVLTVACATLIALLTLRSSRRVAARATRAPTSIVRRMFRASKRPEVGEGIRAAYSTNRGAGLVVALAGSAVAVFLAAVVFGTSLTTLTSTPASYGWPWDVAIIGNYGYYPPALQTRGLAARLDRRDDVRSWTALGFSNSIMLDGDSVPAVIGFNRLSAVDVAVVEGRLPTGADEVALGSRTAEEQGLGVGDKVGVTGYEVTARRARVTGIVVLPALGPFQAARAAPGSGVLIPEAMLKRSVGRGAVSFVGVDLRPGVDTKTLAGVGRELDSLVPKGTLSLRRSSPVRPAEIINARSVRVAPLLVGGLLVAAATIGLAVAIVISVRARRRDMALLRTLGFTSRQLRVSVRVQALAMMFGGFAVGAPLGTVIGRAAWRAFALQLGVVPTASIPVVWIVATGVGAVLVAALAAAGPARAAARTKPSVALRTE